MDGYIRRRGISNNTTTRKTRKTPTHSLTAYSTQTQNLFAHTLPRDETHICSPTNLRMQPCYMHLHCTRPTVFVHICAVMCYALLYVALFAFVMPDITPALRPLQPKGLESPARTD